MEKFSVEQFFTSLLVLLIFVLIANILKKVLFQKLIIPPSLVAGFLLLAVGPNGFGVFLSNWLEPIIVLPNGLIPNEMLKIWKEMPGYWISVVFAGLFLGKIIPNIGKVWSRSLPNLVYGYTLALGQYIIGLLVALLLLKPLYDIDVLSGALIPIGFQGGHGTVAGLKSTFEEMDFNEGFDLGLGIATVGLLSSIIFGTIMTNISSRKEDVDDMKMDNDEDTVEVKNTSFVLQLALLATAIGIGWVMLSVLQIAEESLISKEGFKVFKYVPLFPMAMIGGLLIQLLVSKLSLEPNVSRVKIDYLTNLALDLLIVSALASLSIDVIKENWQVLVILAFFGIAYNIFVYFILAKKLFGEKWKVQGLGELGQSMGTTAIGLLLLKRTGQDSEEQIDSFSYKQPLYEPIVGGGLVTAVALPLISQIGIWYFVTIVATILLGILLLYFITKN